MTIESDFSEIHVQGWYLSHINFYLANPPWVKIAHYTCVILKSIPEMEIGIIIHTDPNLAMCIKGALNQIQSYEFKPITIYRDWSKLKPDNNTTPLSDFMSQIKAKLLTKPANKPASGRRF